MTTLQITVRAGNRCPYLALAELNGRSFQAIARDPEEAARRLFNRVRFTLSLDSVDESDIKHVSSEQDAEIYRVEW